MRDRPSSAPLSDPESAGLALPAPGDRPEGTQRPGAAGLSSVPYPGANPSGPELGFAPLAAVQASADRVPVAVGDGDQGSSRYVVEVSPGVVRLSVRGSRVVGQSERQPAQTAGRGQVSAWSARSRNRMIVTLATLDWSPVLASPSTRPAMVTLTYPGDWRAVCPDGRVAKRHLDAFRRQWVRDFEENPGREDAPSVAVHVPFAGVWKLEHQARGAPHFHLYLPCPLGTVAVRRGRGRSARWTSLRFTEWLSETWASIVKAEGDEYRRHLVAGTGLDFGKGVEGSDPKRLAIYFSRHNAKGKSKAYQHELPDEWPFHGRWWGVWGLRAASAEVSVDRDDFIEARRILRRWVRAQGRVYERRVPRTDTATGEVRRRKVTRRYEVRALAHGRAVGGFVLANDGPGLAAALGKWLTLRHLDDSEAA